MKSQGDGFQLSDVHWSLKALAGGGVPGEVALGDLQRHLPRGEGSAPPHRVLGGDPTAPWS